MTALGMGNGAVFQLVLQRFGRDVGLMTGFVGMTGGIGGFYLAASLGYAKQRATLGLASTDLKHWHFDMRVATALRY
jgi:nitrate/nitrite transporter NarK